LKRNALLELTMQEIFFNFNETKYIDVSDRIDVLRDLNRFRD